MKILISAFSCGPGRGSEPGVGWNVALEAARLGHDVTVLTQSEFRAEIEREVAAGRVPSNLRFDIFTPRWLERLRDAGVRYGLSSLVWQPVSLIWQFYALAHAKRCYREAGFDLVHHVTFAQIRHPTLLTRLGLPTVLGPLGGGDRVPPALRRSFARKDRYKERLRDVYNAALRLDPLTRGAFRDAALILLRTGAGLAAVPPSYRDKVLVRPGLGIAERVASAPRPRAAVEPLRLIYVGNLFYLKGGHLAVRALARARSRGVDATLTVIGDGPARRDFETLARELGVSEQIVFRGQIARADVISSYDQHHALLFPSLRDAAPTVIVEAWAFCLPIICLALGGPGEMVDSSCGRAVEAEGRSEEECVDGLADAIVELSTDEQLRLALGRGAAKRYRECSWARIVASLYEDIGVRLRTAARTGEEDRGAMPGLPLRARQ
jgi:glycosyltransferase involved in cell wall biosynthesis